MLDLFGEGALSGSFIPVYAGLLSTGKQEEADRVAGAVGALLATIIALLVAAGVLLTPALIDLIAPGFAGDKRTLTIALVRILFPGAGLLVLSAWCLGILNSHHKFLLSYAAPVVWNAAMIATLFVYGGGYAAAAAGDVNVAAGGGAASSTGADLPRLAIALAWGSVLGSALQFIVQVPAILRVARPRLSWDTTSWHVRSVLLNFVPVFISRGVVQVSAYVDTLLASLLPTLDGAHQGLLELLRPRHDFTGLFCGDGLVFCGSFGHGICSLLGLSGGCSSHAA